MSYRTNVTGTNVLAGSTAAVLVTGAIAAQLAAIESWAYASNSGGVFTFYLGNGTALPNPLTLPLATLDGSLLGQQARLGALVGSSLTTLASITPGNQALVQVDTTTWKVVRA